MQTANALSGSGDATETSAVDRIRADHLLHLIRKSKAPEGEKRVLQLKLESGTLQARIEVIDRLEQLDAGLRDRLARVWTAYGRQSLFLWHATAFNPLDLGEVKKLIAKAIERTEPSFRANRLGEAWHRVVPPQNVDEAAARVLRVRLRGDELGATVRISKTHSYVFEDEEREYTLSHDVSLAIDVARSKVARVFGAQQDGRKTMRTFLTWALGHELPDRKPALDRYMAPIKFSERQVMRLAQVARLECVGMEGPDSKGVVGRVGFEGKAKDYHLNPLDLEDARVMAQHAFPQDSRTYNFQYAHEDDGFKESSRVVFHLSGYHPHLSFPVRTSQGAMEHIVDRLLEQVVHDQTEVLRGVRVSTSSKRTEARREGQT